MDPKEEQTMTAIELIRLVELQTYRNGSRRTQRSK